ncbi:hypothetical protein CSUB01_11589 [Colletotrichum sublineola]|uniref:Uncharacterized protein n=1 Tax=Colletotrichum sublineola TaxID=1173701 RepID=A0A066XKM2_COLSU|nr:hypothetical protein CSUB01_11589 [Colletotrichum sublineola]
MSARLRPIQDMFQRWKVVDCQLCFAMAGQVRSGHGLDNCYKHGRSGGAARLVLQWLDEIKLCRPGSCRFCLPIEAPCQDIIASMAITSSSHSTEEDKEF